MVPAYYLCHQWEAARDVNQEVKTGSEECNCAIDTVELSCSHVHKKYCSFFLLCSAREVEGGCWWLVLYYKITVTSLKSKLFLSVYWIFNNSLFNQYIEYRAKLKSVITFLPFKQQNSNWDRNPLYGFRGNVPVILRTWQFKK